MLRAESTSNQETLEALKKQSHVNSRNLSIKSHFCDSFLMLVVEHNSLYYDAFGSSYIFHTATFIDLTGITDSHEHAKIDVFPFV